MSSVALNQWLFRPCLVVACLSVILLASSGSAAAQAVVVDPVDVVEGFLAARNASDAFGATGWCAAVLELQDADGLWLVDEPSARYWLGQLLERYVVDLVSPPVAEGNTVRWTERLTSRGGPFRQAVGSSMRIDVSAVIRDNKIVYLSGPYPPIPLRRTDGPLAEPPVVQTPESSAPASPAVLFGGSALVVVASGLALGRGGPFIAAARRRTTGSRRRL